MVIKEKIKYYTSSDIIDRINDSLLNDEAKDVLITYVEDMSMYLIEIYHQLSRQSLTVNYFKKYKDIDNNFAQLIFDMISSAAISKDYVSKKLSYQNNLIDDLVHSVQTYVALSVYDRLLDVQSCISNLSTEFLNKCNGIVANNQDIYNTNFNLDDFTVPKYYKLSISDDETTELENTKSDDILNNTWDRVNKPDIKLVSLKQLGLKIRKS